MFALEINTHAWTNLANVLWVEQPVGTGFSTEEPTATSEEDIAADIVNFFANFEDTFGIKNFEIIQRSWYPDIRSLHRLVHLYGQQVPVVPVVLENNNVLNFNEIFLSMLEKLHKSCGYAKFREDYCKFPPTKLQPEKYLNSTSDADCDPWGIIYEAAYKPNPCFNEYEIGLQCPLLGDVLGFPTDFIYSYTGVPAYFKRTDVKKVMRAPLDVTWSECNPGVFIGEGGPGDEGDSSANPIQKVLPRVIEATNRVLIANGDSDLEILTNGTLLSIQNMTLGGKLGFRSKPTKPIVIKLPDLQYEAAFDENGFNGFDDPQGTMGIQHYEHGLIWAETFLSGHMQPQFQPRSNYNIWSGCLGIPTPCEKGDVDLKA